MKKLILLVLMTISSLIFSATEDERYFELRELSNKMKYYSVNKKSSPRRAVVSVVIKAGSLQEDDDERIGAHFLEHMVFNGTKLYKGNEVIRELESLGLKFGEDLNASTSFNETVFSLKLPTDNKEDFEKGIHILTEMIFNPLIDEAEVEKERKIIKEEWRLTQGIGERIARILTEVNFGNSRYGKRLPLGSLEEIKKITREKIKTYHEKWYVPENMAVLVVGDIEKDYIDKTIIKYFGEKKNTELKYKSYYPLNEIEEKYYVFRDKEIESPKFHIINSKKISLEKTIEEKSRIYFLRNFINNRLRNSIASQGGLISGESMIEDYMENRYFTIVSSFSESKIKEGIKETLNSLKYINEFGVSQEEFELEMDSIISSLEKSSKNRVEVSNEEMTEKLVGIYIQDKEHYKHTDYLGITRMLKEKIEPREIQDVAHEIYEDDITYILFLPENNNTFESKEELEEYILKIRGEEVQKDKNLNYELILKDPDLKKGKVIKIEDKKEYKEITLSNGLSFLYKNIDYKKDEVYISIFKEEGSSIDNHQEYLNAIFASNFIIQSGVENLNPKNLNIYNKGKNYIINSHISNYEQEISIKSDEKSLEEGLKYFSYLVRNPKLDKDLFEKNKENLEYILRNKDKTTVGRYNTETIKLLYGNHPRKRDITLNELDLLSREKMLEIFKEKFINFSNYKGIIVGSLDEERAIEILEKYFASLNASPQENKGWKPLNFSYPVGKVEKIINGGEKNSSLIHIYFPIERKYSVENNYLGHAAKDILKIKLLEKIREEISGIYSVSLDIDMNLYEKGFLSIGFLTGKCEKEKVLKKVKDEVEKFMVGSIDRHALESVKKNYKLSYESNKETSFYWKKYLKNLAIEKDYKVLTPLEYNELITEENLKEYLKEFIFNENVIKIILEPEIKENEGFRNCLENEN